ncbi:MAG: hypothetical protein IKO64_05530 [Kiritimatiellae bacterium]|nr:hypothetical protein [Kiritimatiellia bacterium]
MNKNDLRNGPKKPVRDLFVALAAHCSYYLADVVDNKKALHVRMEKLRKLATEILEYAKGVDDDLVR